MGGEGIIKIAIHDNRNMKAPLRQQFQQFQVIPVTAGAYMID
jgi:hypothetical protein